MSELDVSQLVGDDGTIDARRLNVGREQKIDAETCATLRRRCRENHARVTHLADEYNVCHTTIASHVRGECRHEHDVAPVGGDSR